MICTSCHSNLKLNYDFAVNSIIAECNKFNLNILNLIFKKSKSERSISNLSYYRGNINSYCWVSASLTDNVSFLRDIRNNSMHTFNKYYPLQSIENSQEEIIAIGQKLLKMKNFT